MGKVGVLDPYEKYMSYVYIVYIYNMMCIYIYIIHNYIHIYGYGSIPIHTIFRGMNIHLPAILMFTRGTRF